MHRRLPTIIAALPLAAALVIGLSAATALGAPTAGAQTGLGSARGFAPGQVVVKFAGERFGRAVPLPPGVGVHAATAALRDNPKVAYATPNYIASISAADAKPESDGSKPGNGKGGASAASDPEVLVPNDTGQLDPGGL